MKRLHAKAIPHEPELALAAIPGRDREHADEGVERIAHAKAIELREHDLGVGTAAERRAIAFEFRAKLEEVVDLAVEDRDESARRRGHRLIAERGEVLDLEPAEAEGDSILRRVPGARAVRSARGERRRHALRRVARAIRESGDVEASGDSAHVSRRGRAGLAGLQGRPR